MVRRHLIKPRRFAHRLAGEVHVGLGLHHQDFVAVFLQNTGPRLKPQLVEFEIFLFHQAVQRQPAHVVAGGFVLGARVAQPHQDPVNAAALIPIKKQGSRLLLQSKEGLQTQSLYYNTVFSVCKAFS